MGGSRGPEPASGEETEAEVAGRDLFTSVPLSVTGRMLFAKRVGESDPKRNGESVDLATPSFLDRFTYTHVL